MARPLKQGVDYFPLDVGFLQDIKVRRIMRACGTQSIPVLISLLANIYRNEGYFLRWDNDMPFLIADELGVSEGAVTATVDKAVQVEFFDANMFHNHGVLTSSGIQKRFFKITSRRKEVDYDARFLLKNINVDNNEVNVCNNPVNVVDNKQSKVKESKVKNSKKKSKKEKAVPEDLAKTYAGENKELLEALTAFREMRQKIKKPLTDYALKLALGKLDKLSQGDESLKVAIVNQSIENGWQGFYEYKGETYGKDYGSARRNTAQNRAATSYPTRGINTSWEDEPDEL